jgi:ubiquitin carboxyl-terminal hydrolase 5/13
VKRTRKEQKKRVSSVYLAVGYEADRQDSLEPPSKKLAISAPSDEELYNYSTSLRCFGCSSVGEVIQSDDPAVSF